ncbi:MAG: carbohydrate binding family 9 domain-containing protein [Saprospiraceae bacterium]|nr:carbohydrate binding family 9 domain-containing protein [Saprospiraceae bacterium]MDW8483923.1 DUF5916 domain-containing protein [Saprospiraceae bacterium]
MGRIALVCFLCTAAYQLLCGQQGLLVSPSDVLSCRRVTGRSPDGLNLRRATTPITLDGRLDEPSWAEADVATEFVQQFPADTSLAHARTEVRFTFDDRFLYVGAICWQKITEYTVSSLKRDFSDADGDALNVLLNPSRDGLNGFLFGVSPLNVQREALIDNGTNLSLDWDNRWNSAVLNHPDCWVVEMAIPFKTLRYSRAENANIWHINLVRVRLKAWEISTWHPVPRQYEPISLAFCHSLHWQEPPPPPGLNAAIIPYAILRHQTDFQRQPPDLALSERIQRHAHNFGADAKVSLTPSLNLDLTLNPDFSQVEVDRQLINLSRFELFFPERRQFFLENRDLFAMFGFPTSRPFFSRRIGLVFNPVTGFYENVPILAGARLSGKLTDAWRIGLLNMQTARVNWDTTRALPAANFTVAAIQRKMFARSAISAIFVNKENFLSPLNETQRRGMQPWNRVVGLEYNLYSADNRWEGEWYYHRSFSPNPRQCGQTAAQYLSFMDRNFSAYLGYFIVDSFYTAEVGFVPRLGYQRFFGGGGPIFYPTIGKINTWSVEVDADYTYSLFGQQTDRTVSLGTGVTFQDQTQVSTYLLHTYTFLFEDFDPTYLHQPGTQPLPSSKGYTYNQVGFYFASSRTYDFQGSGEVLAGQFFNGHALLVSGELAYRWQPYGIFSLRGEFNRIRLPAPYPRANVWNIGARAELTLSRSLFASAFFQWNTQANNFNMNARFQWRFAPVSDIFLVYTDNAYAQAIAQTSVRFLSPKNRALVLKVVYWLNA